MDHGARPRGADRRLCRGARRREVPGLQLSWSQPIEMRMQDLLQGVRSDVAVIIYGDDPAALRRAAEATVQAVARVPGAADVKAEQTAGQPYLRVIIDREAVARYGLNASDVLDVVEALGGRTVGTLVEGNARFDIRVRLRPEDRADPDRIRSLRIADANGRAVPLTQLARVVMEDGPAQVSRERGRRRITVEANVRGRDIASFVGEAQAAVQRQVHLPPGYSMDWGGQFQNLQEATARLTVVVPAALALIFGLLYVMFRSLRLSALIFVNVPFAATGGVLALWLRDLPFSISAAVGFIALFGIAVLNGVVLVSTIVEQRLEGKEPDGGGARRGDAAAPPGADDGDRRQPRLPADGDLDQRRGGGAAAAGDRGDRRAGHRDDADAAGAADAVSVGSETEVGEDRGRRYSPRTPHLFLGVGTCRAALPGPTKRKGGVGRMRPTGGNTFPLPDLQCATAARRLGISPRAVSGGTGCRPAHAFQQHPRIAGLARLHRCMQEQLLEDILLRMAAAELVHALQRRPHRSDRARMVAPGMLQHRLGTGSA